MSSRLLRQAAALAVLALLGTVAVPPANAQPSGVSDDAALDWLRAAATAPLRVSYAGTKAITVWGAQAHASQVRIYHEAAGRTRLEYVASGNRPRRIVIISDGRVQEYTPALNQVTEQFNVRGDEAQLARTVLPQILSNYSVTFGPDDEVAGRPTKVIIVQSKFPGRPSLKLWVDRKRRLILRLERYRADGMLLQTTAFLNVQFDPIFPADLFTLPAPPSAQVQRQPARTSTMMSTEEVAREVGFIPQIPAYLPSGFQLTRIRVVRVGEEPTAAFVYSDGVSTLTLFESRGARGWSPPRGELVRIGTVVGTVAARGSVTLLHWNIGGISYTLVGELSEDDLVRIGASIPAVIWEPRPSGLTPAWAFSAPAGSGPGTAAASGVAPVTDWRGVPPPPVSPYITTDTHPIGPGLRDEEVRIWKALASEQLTPFVVKVTVASDGVSRMPNGLIGHLAWIWFVYGMDWAGDAGAAVREAQAGARAVAVTAMRAVPRIDQVVLTGQFQVSGPFEGRRTDVTFTARLYRERLLAEPQGLDLGSALARAGDVWYSPALLAGALTMAPPRAHTLRLAPGAPQQPALPGERTSEAGEHFAGTFLQRLVEAKYHLAGLLFGIESHDRLWRGNPRRREIALTFDDGPSPVATPLLLAILQRYGAHATFFVIGEHAIPYPYLVKQMVAEGHEVGNHTFHHPNLTTVDTATLRDEVDAAAAVIGGMAGRPRWFRPPGGDYSPEVAEAARTSAMGMAMWTANSGDWALPPPKVLTERVLARAESGAIILLHNGTLNTVRALPGIIVELQRRGYKLVTLSQLARDTE